MVKSVFFPFISLGGGGTRWCKTCFTVFFLGAGAAPLDERLVCLGDCGDFQLGLGLGLEFALGLVGVSIELQRFVWCV